MKSCVEYLQSRPNRWIVIERKSDPSEPGKHFFAMGGWLCVADELGVVIFGKAEPHPLMMDADSPQMKEDSHFIAWSEIASIHFNQDKESG